MERPLDLDSDGQLVASVLSKKIAAGVERIISCNTVWHPTNAIDLSGAVVASVQALLAV